MCAGAPLGRIVTRLPPGLPTSTADRTAREARPRGGGHAAARPAALTRTSITPYTQVTPIEIPIRIREGAGYAVGVQWHPEAFKSGEPSVGKLFEDFVAAAGGEA